MGKRLTFLVEEGIACWIPACQQEWLNSTGVWPVHAGPGLPFGNRPALVPLMQAGAYTRPLHATPLPRASPASRDVCRPACFCRTHSPGSLLLPALLGLLLGLLFPGGGEQEIYLSICLSIYLTYHSIWAMADAGTGASKQDTSGILWVPAHSPPVPLSRMGCRASSRDGSSLGSLAPPQHAHVPLGRSPAL